MRTPSPKAFCIVVTVLVGAQADALVAQSLSEPKVLLCEEVSFSRPDHGAVYSGPVSISAYQFSAVIPKGAKAWGAAPGAPFHGFTIYWTGPSDSKACIDFKIGVHVDLPEEGVTPQASSAKVTSVQVGNRAGTQLTKVGTRHGVRFENVIVAVGLVRGGETDDVEITLVTPVRSAAKFRSILDKFVSGLKFQ